MRAKPPSPAPRDRKPEWTRDVPVVLITRLFGGGAKAREIDPLSWLRSSAAKSALRAWWRAGHAHEFSSLADLRAREEVLFGASATFDDKGRPQKGPGALEVLARSELGSAPTEYTEGQGSIINYALFPASGMGQPRARIVMPSDQTKASIELRSRSNRSEDQDAILDGLRLWLTLGGVGARTRRGAGALALADQEAARKLGLPATLEELKTFLRKRCLNLKVSTSLPRIFCLARTRRIFVGLPQRTGEDAQKKLLLALRDARQDRPKPEENRFGRTNWPEADAIRWKADPRRAWVHAPDVANKERYPRAALGLPIVVHYKDRPPVEPKDHHILAAMPVESKPGEWTKIDRYSSPMLLRPVRIWDNGRVLYVPVAIFTDSTLPGNVRPLVVTDPGADLNPRDVVKSYDIDKDANATLGRIEAVFEKAPGFQSL